MSSDTQQLIPPTVLNAPIGISVDRERALVIFKKEQYHILENEAAEALGFEFINGAYVCKIRRTAKEALFEFLKLSFYQFLQSTDENIISHRTKLYSLLNELYTTDWDKVWTIIKPRLEVEVKKKGFEGKLLHEVLMKHQKEGVILGCVRENNLISFQQGLGKSITALCITLAVKSELTIVVAPSVCKLNWYDELKEWGIPADQISVIDANKRACKYAKNEKFILINYDILKERYIQQLVSKRPSHIIFDECHYIKNTESKRFKNSKILINTSGAKITLLSGTPIKNRLDDMFAYCNLTKRKLGFSKIHFEDRFLEVEKNGKYGKKIKGAKNFEVLSLLISNFMIRKTKEQCLDLPKKINHNYYFKLEEYKEEYDRQLEEYEKSTNKEAVIMRLMITTTKAKMKGIIELAEMIIGNDEKLVIFCSFSEPIKMLLNHFGKSAVVIQGGMSSQEKKDAENKFKQDDSVMILVGQTTAAGVGINLVNACNVISCNYPFTYAEYEQTIDRLHRIGQTEIVNIYNPICEKSVDEYVFNLVMKKFDDASKVVDKKAAELDFNNITSELLDDVLGKKLEIKIEDL